MIVERRRVRIDVLMPSSFSLESHHPVEKMVRLGSVARALAACRVETLIIYHEEPGSPLEENARHIKLVMDYMNTAPYLRRIVFPLKAGLRYAGALPPLNIPTHPEKPSLNVEHFREGLVTSSGRGSVIEAGLGRRIKVARRLREGARVVVLVRPSDGSIRFKVYSKRRAKVYSGFKTAVVAGKLDEIVKGYDVKIATSRQGTDVRDVLEELGGRLQNAEKICVVFGSAKRGLHEIAGLQGIKLEEIFDYVLNTFPGQGVRTIRTEEALAYTLGIINLITP